MSEHTTTAINSNGQDLIVSTCECGRTLTVMLPPLAERVQAALTDEVLTARMAAMAGDYATIAPPMLSPVEQHKRAVRVTFVTIWLMIAGCLAAAWWWL